MIKNLKNVNQNPMLAGFKPDVHVVIKVESSTGRTVIESGNGVAINPLNLISICLSVAKGNMDAYLKTASMLVDHSRNEDPAARPHAFEQSIEAEPLRICKICNKLQPHAIHLDNEGNPIQPESTQVSN